MTPVAGGKFTHSIERCRTAYGEQVLRQRLRARGLLESVDAGRQMLVVRRTLEGSPRQVLALARQRRAGSQRREQTGKVSVGAPITTGW
jgi:hypothetical protein